MSKNSLRKKTRRRDYSKEERKRRIWSLFEKTSSSVLASSATSFTKLRTTSERNTTRTISTEWLSCSASSKESKPRSPSRSASLTKANYQYWTSQRSISSTSAWSLLTKNLKRRKCRSGSLHLFLVRSTLIRLEIFSNLPSKMIVGSLWTILPTLQGIVSTSVRTYWTDSSSGIFSALLLVPKELLTTSIDTKLSTSCATWSSLRSNVVG